MQSFSRGWSFLKQAWQMAFKDSDLLKPSLYALFAGMVVSIVGGVFLAGGYFIFGSEGIGGLILFLLGGGLVFAEYLVAYIFSAMTIQLIYAYLTEGDGRLDKAWSIVRRDFFDILTLALASTAVNLLKRAAQNSKKKNLAASLARSATGLLDALWTEAAALVLPAMIVDDLNLKNGLQRVMSITRSNLLLVGISTVGVPLVTSLISLVFGAVGLALGILVGSGLSYASGGSNLLSGAGIVLGALVFFTFVMLASVFSTYTNTAYHTCLYLWARQVESARAHGSVATVPAPAPLAAALR